MTSGHAGALPLLLKQKGSMCSNSGEAPNQRNCTDFKQAHKNADIPQSPFGQVQCHDQQAQREASAALTVLMQGNEDLLEVLTLASDSADLPPPALNEDQLKDGGGKQHVQLHGRKDSNGGTILPNKSFVSLIGSGRCSADASGLSERSMGWPLVAPKSWLPWNADT